VADNMTDKPSAIEELKSRAAADPNDEIAHFSLGRALLAPTDGSAPDPAEAAKALQRVIALNPNISKAYQLLGDAQLKSGHRDYAIETLTEGVNVAHRRGDMMPQNEMMKMLADLGAPVPKFEDAKTAVVSAGEVYCKRHSGVGPKLEKPPMRNAFGQEIFENICANCWKEAIGFGTKVINELRLPLSDPQAQKMWDQHIREFLNLK
jgi:Fe-S cluster biosynthesis and repair protein YggX